MPVRATILRLRYQSQGIAKSLTTLIAIAILLMPINKTWAISAHTINATNRTIASSDTHLDIASATNLSRLSSGTLSSRAEPVAAIPSQATQSKTIQSQKTKTETAEQRTNANYLTQNTKNDNQQVSQQAVQIENKIANQRYHYELAKSALKAKNKTKFATHYAQLGDYPLVPYLDYTLIKRDIRALPLDRIDIFLAANQGTFLETRVREQVLFELARQKKWSKYTPYFHADIQVKELQCFNLLARFNNGDQTALKEVSTIWVHGKSLPKACDPLFSIWRKSGGLTDEIAWNRFHKAMQSRNNGLARYISSLMSPAYKAYADKYLLVHSYPARIKKHEEFADHSNEMQQVIAHGIKRLARRSPKSSLHHWERYEAKQMFAEETSRDTQLYIAKRLASKGLVKEAEQLIEQSSELRQADIIERLIRESLKNQQWSKVVQWIDHLPEKQQMSDRWLYWRARAREQIVANALPLRSNKTDQTTLDQKPTSVAANSTTDIAIQAQINPSQRIYEKLAKKRSFYGFLSSDKLSVPYSFTHKSAVMNRSTEQIVKNNASIRRAKELWLRGNFSEAHAEWLFGTSNMSPEELMVAGSLASKWGWHNKGIVAMISGKHWDVLDVRFPLAYQQEINEASQQTSVEVPLMYAIARQESAFRENAKSHAGAMGLMQLLPSTARQTAKKNGLKMFKNDLYKPEINLFLGGHYLNELLAKFNGNRILAAAAYNAGPHRVSKWMNKSDQLPFDVWIETIPFKETRGYVQNVLAFSVIYAAKLGQDSQFITPQEATSLL